MFQIENEYGSIRYSNWLPDKEHTSELKSIYDSQGMGDTLYFTSDSPAYSGDMGSVEGGTVQCTIEYTYVQKK